MSAETKAALDNAIAAHFADVMDGALVNGYLLQIAGESVEDVDNGEFSALRETSDTQSPMTTLGLVEYARAALRAEVVGDGDE